MRPVAPNKGGPMWPLLRFWAMMMMSSAVLASLLRCLGSARAHEGTDDALVLVSLGLGTTPRELPRRRETTCALTIS